MSKDYQIVEVNVSQTVGMMPSKLQQTGALLSMGGSNLPAGSIELITQFSELLDLASLPIEEVTIGYHSMTLTIGASLPYHYQDGDTIEVSLSGFSPAVYNGAYLAMVELPNKLRVTVPIELPDVVILGNIQIPDSAELLAMGRTFFAQGSKQSVYVYEMGAGDVDVKVQELEMYISDPSIRFYAYLVPKSWDRNEKFIQLAKNYSANTSMLYFFVTTQGPGNPYNGIKSVIVMAEEYVTPYSECSIASMMWAFISASPSDINKVAPMAFRYLIGVTKKSEKGSYLAALNANNINYVGTGAEGGISNTVLFKGVGCDGNDLTYWYSVDWIQINAHMALANEVINGSNNPINPLYYNQDGINRLQNRAQSVFNTGVIYGLVNGNPQVGAVSFREYSINNPNDYALGRYAGLSAEYTPMRGFIKVIFNINVTMQLS
ncbi:hypothetical protein [Budvicia aquatica]|uniref:Uncharacterized protein n=1 Tax=Budvicia aquatica TaxID=82979 RepID=A0A2C6DS59_9GAMM|nr:hypothetical protein [Budvicia aquatica]PHI31162.1 hypothetical protein CRN84_18360 [Budvicia aquatica]VFS51416.1 Uncharacterised protein [Budvicia aquatica]